MGFAAILLRWVSVGERGGGTGGEEHISPMGKRSWLPWETCFLLLKGGVNHLTPPFAWKWRASPPQRKERGGEEGKGCRAYFSPFLSSRKKSCLQLGLERRFKTSGGKGAHAGGPSEGRARWRRGDEGTVEASGQPVCLAWPDCHCPPSPSPLFPLHLCLDSLSGLRLSPAQAKGSCNSSPTWAAQPTTIWGSLGNLHNSTDHPLSGCTEFTTSSVREANQLGFACGELPL